MAGTFEEPPPSAVRCGWASGAPEYVEYHDQEWGRTLHGEDALFERLSLETFQSGLSWITILRKRPAFRIAFHGFDIDAVARLGQGEIESLLQNSGIVRNRAKIQATVQNARAAQRMRDDSGLDALLWSYAPAGGRVRPLDGSQVPATIPESVAMAKELRRLGFTFVGPTTCYALMQATGMVDDHVSTCWLATPE